MNQVPSFQAQMPIKVENFVTVPHSLKANSLISRITEPEVALEVTNEAIPVPVEPTNMNITTDDKQYVIDEELLQFIITTFGFECVLWDNDEPLGNPAIQHEYNARVTILQQKIWNEGHQERRNRVEMAKSKLVSNARDIKEMETKIKSRVSARLRRLTEPAQKRQERLERDKLKSRKKRLLETPAEKEVRRQVNREAKRVRRQMETLDEREERLKRTRDLVRKRRAKQRELFGDKLKMIESEKARLRRQKKLESETAEERQSRLERHRFEVKQRRMKKKMAQSIETDEERCLRIAKMQMDAQKRKDKRSMLLWSETAEQKETRLARQRFLRKKLRNTKKDLVPVSLTPRLPTAPVINMPTVPVSTNVNQRIVPNAAQWNMPQFGQPRSIGPKIILQPQQQPIFVQDPNKRKNITQLVGQVGLPDQFQEVPIHMVCKSETVTPTFNY